MKKIKSVKLKNDYRDLDKTLPKGHALKCSSDTGNWGDGSLYFRRSDIEANKTDLFEIEYEEERKYIDVRIEYDNLEGSFGTLNMETENIGSALRNMFRPDFDFKITKKFEYFYSIILCRTGRSYVIYRNTNLVLPDKLHLFSRLLSKS